MLAKPDSFVMINPSFLLRSLLWIAVSTICGIGSHYSRTGVVVKEDTGIGKNLIDTEANKFLELAANGQMFVDKSLLIELFLRYRSPVVLITCPSGWGKSINVDMIRSFLQMKVDILGNRASAIRGLSKTYRLFRYGEVTLSSGLLEKLKTPLLISKYRNVMNEHFGRHPVIFVDFKQAVGDSYYDTKNKLRAHIRSIYEEHSYMVRMFQRILNNANVAANKRDETKIMLDKFERILYVEEVDMEEIETSLRFLCEILGNHFATPVFVLMDDYDRLVNVAVTSIYFDQADEAEVIKFLGNLLRHTFKDNQYLKRGFLVGEFGIAKRCLNETADFIEEHLYFNSPFTEYFGFNKKDAELLFDNCKLAPAFANSAHDWFNGYKLHADRDLRFYNAWSIATFLKNKIIKQYWDESAGMNILERLMVNSGDVRFEIILLLGGMKMPFNLYGDDVNVDHIALLFKKDAYDCRGVDFSCFITLFRAYLPIGGFVTISTPLTDSEPTTRNRVTFVEIANKEIATLMATRLLSFYSRLYHIVQKYLLEPSTEMNIFIFNDDLTSSRLQMAMEVYFRHLSCFENIVKVFERNETSERYHDSQQLLINIILIHMQYSQNFETAVNYSKRLEDVIVIRNDKAERGVVLKVTYDEGTPQKALSLAKQCKTAFVGFSTIATIKCIGINICRDRHVQIDGSIENSSPSKT